MKTLISSNEILQKYVPNTLKAVAGELSLFDKIAYHLQQSETWLTQTFLSSKVLEKTITEDDSSSLLHHCRMAVAADAMLHAVPQLDLILTPNGFGIVNNQNIVPASKERVDRLLAGLEKLRDDALTIILSMLPAAHQWTDSEQFRYFADTMFADLDTVQHLGYTEHIWQHFMEIHAQLLVIERRLETEFFSRQLMDILRQCNILKQWGTTADPARYQRLYQRIAAIEFSILRTGEFPIPSIIDAVNFIRTAPANVFTEWKDSETSKLFEDHGYKNKKQSSGYFF